MTSNMSADVLITGVGVTSAIGVGRDAFASALFAGRRAFAVMQREGRQCDTRFLGAEIGAFELPQSLQAQGVRRASLGAQVTALTVHEAWHEAQLQAVDPQRIGLIVGGSNVQQRDAALMMKNYADRPQFIRPTYAMSFMDTDLCGICTQAFGIRGLSHTVGGASASGQVAIIHAIQAVQSGQVDACIAVGAMMDLSHWECQALRSIGAMGSDRFADAPELACRPFDRLRDGFIYGEACGAIVVERADASRRAGVRPYARIAGWSIAIDANRNPDPSLAGEVSAIRQALERARLPAERIDYVNPHGTGSPLGDETEVQALRECGLSRAYINATKSITGHGLSAAGAVEVVATLLQMRAGALHPTVNLTEPIDAALRWVPSAAVEHRIENALSMSLGFGGINSALCLQAL